MCIGTFAMADELERMESIVADIKNLRSDYRKCIKELNSKNTAEIGLETDLHKKQKMDLAKNTKVIQEYKLLLDKEQFKNTMLKVKIDTLNKSLAKKVVPIFKDDKSNLELINTLKTKEKNEKIKNMKSIESFKKKYEKILKNKDNEILSLKNKINSENKTIIVRKEICEDDNQFPKLMMKDSTEKAIIEKASKSHLIISNKEEKKITKEKEVVSKAKTYRLNKESDIYDKIKGSILYTWENKTSFTSTNMTENWLKITGYFEDKKWIKAEEKLWVKKVNATER